MLCVVRALWCPGCLGPLVLLVLVAGKRGWRGGQQGCGCAEIDCCKEAPSIQGGLEHWLHCHTLILHVLAVAVENHTSVCVIAEAAPTAPTAPTATATAMQRHAVLSSRSRTTSCHVFSRRCCVSCQCSWRQ